MIRPNRLLIFRRQDGAVLFVALVFLILLTLLALTATGTSILQEKMTGNMRNRQLGLLGAESGARGGEQHLWQLSFDHATGQPLPPCLTDATGNSTGGVAGCVHRVRSDGGLPSAIQTFRSANGWAEAIAATALNSLPYGLALTGTIEPSETAGLAEQPVIALENLGPDLPLGGGMQTGVYDPETTTLAGKHEFYRITSRSQGGSAAVQRIVESVYSAIDLTNTGTNPGAAPVP